VPLESEGPAVPLGLETAGAGRTTNGRAHELIDADEAFNHGVLLEEQQDLDGAAAAYGRADEHGHAAAASNLGVLLERTGDLAGAETAYRRADERGDAIGAFNLAVLLEEQQDLDGAAAAYRRANQRGPAEVANTARAALLDLHARSVPNGTKRGDNDVV
jgi:tetratricopeptide (TPR) repeat protein